MNLKDLRPRTRVATAAIVAGLALGAVGIGNAATSTSTPAASTTQAASSATTTPQMDPSTVTHGPGETLLTGATADSVTAAAKAAVPGGTIIRVETDAQGSAYEAHMKKSDGSVVTVHLDKSFVVTSTDEGFGGRGGPRL
jgi:hypothetical protein